MKSNQLPMMLTYFRMLVAPPIIIAVTYFQVSHSGLIAATLFIVASLTDWADGYLARKLKVETDEGKLLDPIADKVLVLSALLIFLHNHSVDPWLVFLFLARDFIIGGLRSVAAYKQVMISAINSGKIKTALQMMLIPCLFLADEIHFFDIKTFAYFGLWVSLVISLYAGFQYIRFYNQATGKNT